MTRCRTLKESRLFPRIIGRAQLIGLVALAVLAAMALAYALLPGAHASEKPAGLAMPEKIKPLSGRGHTGVDDRMSADSTRPRPGQTLDIHLIPDTGDFDDRETWTVSSPAFESDVLMEPLGRANTQGRPRVRCDITPGEYRLKVIGTDEGGKQFIRKFHVSGKPVSSCSS